MKLPQPGEQWRHFKGEVYTVRAIARCSETQRLIVVYESNDGERWARRLEDWMEMLRNVRITYSDNELYSGRRFARFGSAGS